MTPEGTCNGTVLTWCYVKARFAAVDQAVSDRSAVPLPAVLSTTSPLLPISSAPG